ncbi:MAG: tRNA 2-thiouridine(34) synthase MnmA [Clostridia bacterium]|nr:tRNA 2-thiouridine(34) synthase MnmA [Clostridia bacterium]
MCSKNKRVLVAMSGGVDSCATAILVANEGYMPLGATMRLNNSSCVSDKDINDAKTACEILKIPHHVVDFSSDFEKSVIKNFVESYENGLTPNPCIECNFKLKFDKLFDFASELDCDLIATGHYARIEYSEKYGRKVLKKATNIKKDQSYVLYRISSKRLNKIIFPLGTINEKSEARELVTKHNIPIGEKKDSQDICFVPDGDYAKFIEEYTKKSYPVGDFVTTDGKFLGKHKGIIRYTIGQRKGLGLALPHSMYVVDKNLDTNQVVIGDPPDLMAKELYADNVVLSALDDISEWTKIKAKVRYNQSEQDAEATLENGLLHVIFNEAQRAISPGQSVVLYDGDIVLGGGRIVSVVK